MDILDIFKTLAEEPGKVGKRGIAAAKLCTNLIFAAYLYRIFIGPYVLINFAELSQYAEFLLSGRFLLGLLFLWISNVLLFNLGADLSFLGIKSFLNRKLTVRSLSVKENLLIRKVLVWRKYIEFDPASKKVGAGQRIDELYELD